MIHQIHANTMNSTEIDSMVRESCQGDAMCVQLMAELDLLELKRSTSDRANFLRRLKQLKSVILHLQPAHHFARYCFYGCWCLPDAAHTVAGNGAGQPVDEVDASCKRQASCYECAQMDHQGRTCSPDSTQYSYNLVSDVNEPDNHELKSIECLDDPNSGKNGRWSEKYSCRRSICECDKKLAEDLRENFYIWTHDNHSEQGTFDPPTQCIKSFSTGSGQEGPPECCGDYPERFPYKSQNGARNCCGNKTYDVTMFECCSDGSLAATGTC